MPIQRPPIDLIVSTAGFRNTNEVRRFMRSDAGTLASGVFVSPVTTQRLGMGEAAAAVSLDPALPFHRHDVFLGFDAPGDKSEDQAALTLMREYVERMRPAAVLLNASTVERVFADLVQAEWSAEAPALYHWDSDRHDVFNLVHRHGRYNKPLRARIRMAQGDLTQYFDSGFDPTIRQALKQAERWGGLILRASVIRADNFEEHGPILRECRRLIDEACGVQTID